VIVAFPIHARTAAHTCPHVHLPSCLRAQRRSLRERASLSLATLPVPALATSPTLLPVLPDAERPRNALYHNNCNPERKLGSSNSCCARPDPSSPRPDPSSSGGSSSCRSDDKRSSISSSDTGRTGNSTNNSRWGCGQPRVSHRNPSPNTPHFIEIMHVVVVICLEVVYVVRDCSFVIANWRCGAGISAQAFTTPSTVVPSTSRPTRPTRATPETRTRSPLCPTTVVVLLRLVVVLVVIILAVTITSVGVAVQRRGRRRRQRRRRSSTGWPEQHTACLCLQLLQQLVQQRRRQPRAEMRQPRLPVLEALVAVPAATGRRTSFRPGESRQRSVYLRLTLTCTHTYGQRLTLNVIFECMRCEP
jgi:hypothetical protein